jgi:hypothetical protein
VTALGHRLPRECREHGLLDLGGQSPVQHLVATEGSQCLMSRP